MHETVLQSFLASLEMPSQPYIGECFDQLVEAVQDGMAAIRRGEAAPLALLLLTHVRDRLTAQAAAFRVAANLAGDDTPPPVH